MTEEELEEMTTEQMDRERTKNAILKLEIENLRKAVEQVKKLSNEGVNK